MRNGFIAVVWVLLIGLGVSAWLSTQDYDFSRVLRFAGIDVAPEDSPAVKKADSPVEAATKAEPGKGVSPTFDIVRVEPDGTAVIAGRAGADADVTVLVNGDPVGSAKADELGEWAVVVDKPLAAGSHSLTISSVAGTGAPVASEQSVAIAVPARKDEKPLIVLSEKGEPSKIIQAPPSVTTVETQPETPSPAPARTAASPGEPQTKTEPEQAEQAHQPAADAPTREPASEPRAVAALESEPAAPAPSPAAPSDGQSSRTLALNTVDYDDKGNMVFQGTGEPGGVVRVYVDNQPVADAPVDEDGTWTLHVLQHIEPGNHKLRVDQLADGAQVASRIELPFTRARPQDVIAAMRGAAPATATEERSAEQQIAAAPPASSAAPQVSAADAAAAPPTPAVTASPTVPATAVQPPAEPGAQSPETPDAEPSPETAAVESPEETPPQEAPAASTALASESAGVTVTVPAPPITLPNTAPSVTPPPAAGSTELAKAEASEPVQPSATVAEGETSHNPAPMPAPTETAETPPPPPPAAPAATAATGSPPLPPAALGIASAAPTISASEPTPAPAPAQPSSSVASSDGPRPDSGGTAPAPASQQQMAASSPTSAPAAKVVQRAGRVIIQPGNNLWNISRVIYGEGVSYTTIYKANADQIRDPDLIYPGQIFRTPGVNPPEEIAPDRREPLPGGHENG